MDDEIKDGYDIRVYTFLAMIKRYGQTSKIMKDRRKKRKNKQSWKKDWL